MHGQGQDTKVDPATYLEGRGYARDRTMTANSGAFGTFPACLLVREPNPGVML